MARDRAPEAAACHRTGEGRVIQGKAHVAELAGLGNQRVYRRAGEYVIDENDPGDELFVILRGRVKVVTMDEDGRELVYAELATGDYFGEMSLDGGRRSASVVTLGPCTLSRVPFPQVRAYLAENPDFAFDLLVTAVKRAREATRLAR